MRLTEAKMYGTEQGPIRPYVLVFVNITSKCVLSRLGMQDAIGTTLGAWSSISSPARSEHEDVAVARDP